MSSEHSDSISRGRQHPNRPLPSFEFSLGSDLETRQRHPEALIAAAEGVYDVIRLMGKDPEFNDRLIEKAEDISGLLEDFRQWNEESESHQINAEDFIHALARAGITDAGHPIYLITAKDVFIPRPKLNFLFGLTIAGLGVSVQSTNRFEAASSDQWWLQESARLMGRHEFGHIVGLNENTIVNKDQRGGLYTSHCTNICTMRQIMSVEDAYQLIGQLDGAPNAGFCNDCVDSLRILGSHR